MSLGVTFLAILNGHVQRVVACLCERERVDFISRTSCGRNRANRGRSLWRGRTREIATEEKGHGDEAAKNHALHEDVLVLVVIPVFSIMGPTAVAGIGVAGVGVAGVVDGVMAGDIAVSAVTMVSCGAGYEHEHCEDEHDACWATQHRSLIEVERGVNQISRTE